jgi:hypothetical protein
MTRQRITEDMAPKIREWIKTRGGASQWESVNLSNPDAAWWSPANQVDGSPTPKPTWQAAESPAQTLISEKSFEVVLPVEVKRFRIALRRSGSGMYVKLTDKSSARVRSECDKAGEGAWYQFDYNTQECIVMRPGQVVPMETWNMEG